MRTPHFTDLLDWVEGRLEPARATEVAEFVAIDDDAAATVAWIEQFLHDARTLQLQRPPAALSSRLRDLFHEHHGTGAMPDRIAATLLHDTRIAATGTRSAGTVGDTHLAFGCELGRFVLEVRAHRDGLVDIAGLVLFDEQHDGAEISFAEGGTLRRVTRSGRDGRFSVEDVPSSVDEIQITTAGGTAAAALDLRIR